MKNSAAREAPPSAGQGRRGPGVLPLHDGPQSKEHTLLLFVLFKGSHKALRHPPLEIAGAVRMWCHHSDHAAAQGNGHSSSGKDANHTRSSRTQRVQPCCAWSIAHKLGGPWHTRESRKLSRALRAYSQSARQDVRQRAWDLEHILSLERRLEEASNQAGVSNVQFLPRTSAGNPEAEIEDGRTNRCLEDGSACFQVDRPIAKSTCLPASYAVAATAILLRASWSILPRWSRTPPRWV